MAGQDTITISEDATAVDIAGDTKEIDIEDRSESGMQLLILGIQSVESIHLQDGNTDISDDGDFTPTDDGVKINLSRLLNRNGNPLMPNADEDKTITLKIQLKVSESISAVQTVQLSFTGDAANENAEQISLYDQIIRIPFPRFTTETVKILRAAERARYLLIDANPDYKQKKNNVICKWKEVDKNIERGGDRERAQREEKDTILAPVRALPVRGTLAVFLLNYELDNVEEITVSLNGQDYTYEFSTQDLIDNRKSDGIVGDDNESHRGGVDEELTEGLTHALEVYLSNIKHVLDSYKVLNIEDYFKIQAYQRAVYEIVTHDSVDVATLALVRESVDTILYWSPKYVSLTPIAHAIPNADEVKVTVTVGYHNESDEEFDIGTYRTWGGINFSLGSSLYVTGLTNNDVYVDSVTIDGDPSSSELRATLDSTNTSSVGIGLNSEIYFRTGELVVPTLNLGFFVPFEEDISPYAALGLGMSFMDKNVKFNLSGGVALGKINTIVDRYKDRDLSGYSDLINEDLVQKAWDQSWYISFGVSYNLNQEQE
ncbi:MAG TPA: hypothetical protein VI603_10545 [Saprospiraceae bacterium]|nr:hypothetical protein [Saprospiraceae bacterium]